jgi:hypothetical protein
VHGGNTKRRGVFEVKREEQAKGHRNGVREGGAEGKEEVRRERKEEM